MLWHFRSFLVLLRFHRNSLSPKLDFIFSECKSGRLLQKFGSLPDSKKARRPILAHLLQVKSLASQFRGMCTWGYFWCICSSTIFGEYDHFLVPQILNLNRTKSFRRKPGIRDRDRDHPEAKKKLFSEFFCRIISSPFVFVGH